MPPELMTDLTITLVIFLVSIGMVFKGKVLKAAKTETPTTSLEKLHKRGAMFLICGSIVAIIQVIKLVSFL
ncbi:hypothetical protein A7985_04035 [Pseudoalteromonas luteoviolacea]|uniref:Uncharacterized protein n=1 Tax=Pseudoalteromonas luteoviolacea TaxID=43657 RepID=A0A1C0TUX8_9GAMM|nr:hypothetical protein [Pseudoalteromonas luteoviolacea]OCQ23128.1 hypothetical protein A7985_04035 [Pseudoalteromonas luteoviolacea]